MQSRIVANSQDRENITWIISHTTDPSCFMLSMDNMWQIEMDIGALQLVKGAKISRLG